MNKTVIFWVIYEIYNSKVRKKYFFKIKFLVKINFALLPVSFDWISLLKTYKFNLEILKT